MSEYSKLDREMMAHAFKLAKRGQYTSTPNPNVGCVIADSRGVLVGEGWHQKTGSPHAEVHALKQAGAKAKGATAYVTLEPCSHQGKTPPCADSLINSGIERVVVAMVDPNPLVSGRGLLRLEEAGVKTQQGLMQVEAESLNRGFIKRMRSGRPWVTVKLAASLDGKTGLGNGQSKWITSAPARQDVQRHRAKSCAILTGSGTAMADDPSLNVRYDELNLPARTLAKSDLRQPLRVILDGRNQLPNSLKCMQPLEDNNAGNVLVINSQENNELFPDHVEQWQAPVNGSKLDLYSVMQKLGDMQLNQIWVEAGAKMAGALLQNNLIDELILYQAPKLIGANGQNLFDISPIESMESVIDFHWTDIRQVGADIKMTAVFNQ